MAKFVQLDEKRTFVVPAEECHRRVVPETLHVVDRLLAHARHKGVEGRVDSARKLEVLPHQTAKL